MTQTPAFALVNPPGLFDPSNHGFSHLGVVAPGTRLVFVAGQGGETVDGKLVPDFRMQVRQALVNLKAALAAVGAETQHVVKHTALIVDHNELRLHIFGEELARAYGHGLKPTCTLIPVSRLALDGMLFEIEATAVLPA